MRDKRFIILLLMIITISLVILNLLGLMRLIPLYITLPLLFLSIYMTVFTLTFRHRYRGRQ